MTLDEQIALMGFRLTSPRKKILTIFAQQHHPISFEEYASLDPTIDKSTFYRTMQTFEQAHIISGIESDEGKRYFELSGIFHPHFICQNCHTIECLRPQNISTPDGYTINAVIYKGVCPSCSES